MSVCEALRVMYWSTNVYCMSDVHVCISTLPMKHRCTHIIMSRGFKCNIGSQTPQYKNLKLGHQMYQQNPQWTIYVKYRQMTIVITFDHCLDLKNATNMSQISTLKE